MNRKRRAGWLLLAAGTAAVDLWTKGLWKYPILATDPPRPQATWIENWLYIETIYNTGGVWSLPIASSLLLWATALAVPLITVWIFLPRSVPAIESAAKALVLGGAAGNLWDRIEYPGVRDFVKVCFGDAEGWCWPTFNVADAALVVGILLLVLLSFLQKKPQEQAAP